MAGVPHKNDADPSGSHAGRKRKSNEEGEGVGGMADCRATSRARIDSAEQPRAAQTPSFSTLLSVNRPGYKVVEIKPGTTGVLKAKPKRPELVDSPSSGLSYTYQFRGFAVWLCSASGSGSKARAAADTLAGELGTKNFPPHVSLEYGLCGGREMLASRLAEFARALRGLPSIVLNPVAFGYGEEDATKECGEMDMSWIELTFETNDLSEAVARLSHAAFDLKQSASRVFPLMRQIRDELKQVHPNPKTPIVKRIEEYGSNRQGTLRATLSEITKVLGFSPEIGSESAEWGFQSQDGRKAFIWCRYKSAHPTECKYWSVCGSAGLLASLFGSDSLETFPSQSHAFIIPPGLPTSASKLLAERMWRPHLSLAYSWNPTKRASRLNLARAVRFAEGNHGLLSLPFSPDSLQLVDMRGKSVNEWKVVETVTL